MTPQGFGWDEIGERNERGGSRGTRRSPTREEFSNMLAQCLIHGSKGILWWPYVNPRRYAWAHFQEMGRQCRFMEPWLLHGKDVPGS
jgi:hypothetical protein